ncbi:MAG: EMC3/TMCO1 family protein [Methanomassiliicoccaceae archaeon]|nr:EMC3/TMCO1 family protein [Methanomassiliicoccaceae archaeon]
MADQPVNAGINPPQKSQLMFMMIAMVLIIALFMEPVRKAVGGVVGIVFEPLIGFHGNYVIITLILAGMIMIGISTIIRTLMSDTVTQTRNQREMSAFNAELRKARIENNLYKIKKLTEQQQAMMSKSMESSMKMMKTMPITMLIVIPIISWVWIFLDGLDPSLVLVSVPWADNVDVTERILFPVWILIYMLITMPFGQILSRLIRWFKFKKRLEEIDGTEIA